MAQQSPQTNQFKKVINNNYDDPKYSNNLKITWRQKLPDSNLSIQKRKKSDYTKRQSSMGNEFDIDKLSRLFSFYQISQRNEQRNQAPKSFLDSQISKYKHQLEVQATSLSENNSRVIDSNQQSRGNLDLQESQLTNHFPQLQVIQGVAPVQNLYDQLQKDRNSQNSLKILTMKQSSPKLEEQQVRTQSEVSFQEILQTLEEKSKNLNKSNIKDFQNKTLKKLNNQNNTQSQVEFNQSPEKRSQSTSSILHRNPANNEQIAVKREFEKLIQISFSNSQNFIPSSVTQLNIPEQVMPVNTRNLGKQFNLAESSPVNNLAIQMTTHQSPQLSKIDFYGTSRHSPLFKKLAVAQTIATTLSTYNSTSNLQQRDCIFPTTLFDQSLVTTQTKNFQTESFNIHQIINNNNRFTDSEKISLSELIFLNGPNQQLKNFKLNDDQFSKTKARVQIHSQTTYQPQSIDVQRSETSQGTNQKDVKNKFIQHIENYTNIIQTNMGNSSINKDFVKYKSDTFENKQIEMEYEKLKEKERMNALSKIVKKNKQFDQMFSKPQNIVLQQWSRDESEEQIFPEFTDQFPIIKN